MFVLYFFCQIVNYVDLTCMKLLFALFMGAVCFCMLNTIEGRMDKMYKLAICDDEKRTLNQLSKIIDWNSFGFEVTATFSNGSDALEYIQKYGLDAVISDIKMPVMDGIELAKRIHSDYPEIKVLLISAYRDFEYAHSAIKYDVVSYVTKPITQSDFSEALLKLKKALDSAHPRRMLGEDADFSIINDNDKLLPEYIQNALNFINEHYADDISLDDVAQNTFIHPGYLSQLLKKYTNESYIDYLTKIRIEKAKVLLVSSDEKISVIGTKVGYNYSQYFHKIFKSVTGITPLEYRRNNRKD